MMQKWHLCSSLGWRSSSITYLQLLKNTALSSRQFHPSDTRAEEGVESDTHTRPSRRERLQDTTEELHKLFEASNRRRPSYRQLTPDRPRTHVPSIVSDTPSRVTGPAQPAGPNVTDASKFTAPRPAASSVVDASKFTAPRPAASNVVDASKISVSPSAAPNVIDASKFSVPRPSTSRPLVRRAQANSKPKNQTIRREDYDSPNDRQQRPTRGANAGGNKGQEDLFRPRHGGRDAVPRKSQTKDWNDDERRYIAAKVAKETEKPVVYQPEEVTQESLIGMGPALALGTWGMSEVVEERLRRLQWKRDQNAEELETLAKMHIERKHLWLSKERMEEVELRAKQILAGTITNEPGVGGEDHVLSEEVKTEMMRKLLGGRYVLPHHALGDVMRDIKRLACRNGSYFPEDTASLTQKAKTLLKHI